MAKRQDRERRQKERADSTPTTFWARIRDRYPERVREVVDPLADLPSPSLRDLLILELAEHERLCGMVTEAFDEGEGLRSVSALASTALQSRKNARAIVQAMGVGASLSDLPVRLPEGVVFELPDDDENLGDEIMS